ncbi:hypothetical protein GCM10020000_83860 [Streptomyces olivoverticillatus]
MLAVIVARFVPNVTALALARLVPVIVTVVPPAVDPWFGLIGMTYLLQTLRIGCAWERTCRGGPRAAGVLHRRSSATGAHSRELLPDTGAWTWPSCNQWQALSVGVATPTA